MFFLNTPQCITFKIHILVHVIKHEIHKVYADLFSSGEKSDFKCLRQAQPRWVVLSLPAGGDNQLSRTHRGPFSLQVPHTQPMSPLIICIPQRISCRQLVASRVPNNPMLNCTMFLGAVHFHQSELSDRYFVSLKGVVQTRRTLQSGPLIKPCTATMKLYSAPATPTAAKAIDRNIPQRFPQQPCCPVKWM